MSFSTSSTININGLSVTISVQTSAESLSQLVGDERLSRDNLEYQDLFQCSVLPAISPLLVKTSQTLSGALIIESCKRLQQELIDDGTIPPKSEPQEQAA